MFPRWLVSKLRLTNGREEAINFMLQFNKLSKKQIEKRFSRYFYEYFKGLIGSEEREKRFALYIYLITQKEATKNSALLDLGCGFGLHSILFSFYGNNVVALDIGREKITVLQRLLRDTNYKLTVFPIIADALNLPLRDGSMDFVYCHEFISHVPDLTKCFKEIERVANEKVIISDTNKICLRQRYKLAFFRDHRKRVKKDFRKKRREILTAYCNAKRKRVPSEVIDKIVNATDGFTKREILQIFSVFVEEHMNLRQLIKGYGKKFPYRDPISEIYDERLFTPHEICVVLKNMGFVTETTLPVPIKEPFYSILQMPLFKEFLSGIILSRYLVIGKKVAHTPLNHSLAF